MGRVDWIEQWLRPGDRVVDLGCGTGYMVTLPLLVRGHDVLGLDPDPRSIEFGRGLFGRAGLDPERLVADDLASVAAPVDALVVSEVLEHMPTDDVRGLLALAHAKLAAGGRILITVPNGRGWYEAEAALWRRLRIDGLLRRPRFNRALYGARHRLLGGYVDAAYPSTLAPSPHVQRFSLASLSAHVEGAGFDVLDRRGSVMVSGPFTHVMLTGVEPFMDANRALGRRFPRHAAGFYVAGAKRA